MWRRNSARIEQSDSFRNDRVLNRCSEGRVERCIQCIQPFNAVIESLIGVSLQYPYFVTTNRATT